MKDTRFIHEADRSLDHSLKYHAPIMQENPNIIPLWVADMDFETPAEVKEALCERASLGVFGYTSPWPGYVESVLSWMKRRHQIDLKPEWLLTTPGIVPAIKIIIQALTEPEDEILILEPVYYPFRASIEELGRTCISSSLREENGIYSIDFDDLEQKMAYGEVRMMIFCSPHNPTGNVWSREDLERVAELCVKYEVLMLSDEIHMDFDPDHLHTSMLMADPKIQDQLILATAPSKTFNLPGLQDSNLFVPNTRLREAIRRTMSRCGMSEPNVLGLVACKAAYDHGDAWVDELNEYIRENALFVKSCLDERIPEIRMQIPQGTYLLWLDCRDLGLNDHELNEFFLKEAELWLNEGYRFGTQGSGYMRLNAACPRSTLEAAMDRLEAAVRNLREKNSEAEQENSETEIEIIAISE